MTFKLLHILIAEVTTDQPASTVEVDQSSNGPPE